MPRSYRVLINSKGERKDKKTLILASDKENVIKDKQKEAMREGRLGGNTSLRRL